MNSQQLTCHSLSNHASYLRQALMVAQSQFELVQENGLNNFDLSSVENLGKEPPLQTYNSLTLDERELEPSLDRATNKEKRKVAKAKKQNSQRITLKEDREQYFSVKDKNRVKWYLFSKKYCVQLVQLKNFSLITPKLEAELIFKAIETVISPSAIGQTLLKTGSCEQRARKLPSGLVVCLVIAMNLWTSDAMEDILKNLVNGLSRE